jgi:subtilisin family serine protease
VVALMAPGGSPERDPMTAAPMGVLSTIEIAGSGFTYTYYAGTSQAAPFVSGALSLMRAVHPRLGAVAAKRVLQATADPSGKCANPEDPTTEGCGAGLLNVEAAVSMAASADGLPADPRIDNVVHGGYGCALAGGRDGTPASTALLLLLGAALLLVARAIKRA